TDYDVGLNATWELDLWGRVRRGVEASGAEAQATAADLAALRLSLQAELATSYFALRTLDVQKQLLDATVEAYRRSLELTQKRRQAGIDSRAEVRQAETQLRTTEAQAKDVELQRAQLEHAIAVLTGRPPTELSIPFEASLQPPPVIPLELPSALLERRPDIAAA